MSNKVSKKGRNPGVVDNWLDSIGLYRKNVAYDETCLFRAISEQLFDCQIYHERVRLECVEYGRDNYYEFRHLLDEDQWYEHMALLEKHMVVCGNIEIQLISNKYDYDVLVFDAAKQQVYDMSKRNLERNLMLCLMNEDHYDVVYKREHIQNAGFCQSIVYGILYENLFNISNVQNIVHGMLYEKEFVGPSAGEVNNNELKLSIDGGGDSKNVTFVAPPNLAPFPFKVAKALDPTMYRNIEYDAWTEVRRELRLGDWYYGDDNLILGTRCVLNDNNDTYECYIQDIIKNENKCVVYVTKLAQKRTVNYTDLSPEDDAKPWPLPYRNLTVSTALQPQQTDKVLKTPRKRKDKRRIKSCSESSAQSHIAHHQDNMEQDVNAYVGAPLQMQSAENYQDCEKPVEKSQSQHNLLVTPDVPSPMPKFTWDAPWSSYVPVMSEPVAWPHSASPQMNYNVKPMVASAPVIPDLIPYHDAHYPFIYNYHVDNYNSYNAWPAPPQQQQQQQEYAQAQDPSDMVDHKDVEIQEAPPAFPNNYDNFETDRPVCPPLTPASPSVEIYSPIIHITPGTPVMYAHTPEITEMLVPATHVPVYTPPVDLQYVSPGPFIYPPTPPSAWYPPGINSQGFIFPSPQNLTK